MAKVAAADGLTPKLMDVGSIGTEKDGESTERFRLKKELGLLNGVAIIVGVIVGSGIFVSPKHALESAGSKGMALIVWVLSGLLSLIGALCYTELGTMIPKSGGDYAYINEAFGPLPAFLYLWVALLILVPTGNAVTAITFSQYVLQPIWSTCDNAPMEVIILISAVLTCFLTAINCYNVKWVTRVQDTFTIAKVLALMVIFFASVWHVGNGHTENLEGMMDNTNTDPQGIASAFYFGLFSYSGWNYLNFVTEELKEPYKNLPRAICISMPMVTLIYALTNVAFFAVLDTSEILAFDAIAVPYGEKILGYMAWIMPLFVAMCTFGSLNGAIYASSRLFFVGSRNGHLPLAISMIDVNRMTPVPCLIFMCFVTLVVLLFSDVKSLIVYVSSVEAIFTLMSVSGLLWMRYSRPELHRPIHVNILLPIVFLIVCTFIIIFSAIKHPMEVGVGIVLMLAGIPFYIVFIKWQNRPKWLNNICSSFNLTCSKLFMALPEDSKDL